MKSLRQIIDRIRQNPERPWALATLVETQGSTYRKPGARMLVDANGESIGVLSGGCLEDEIVRRGREVIESGTPVLLTFDTRRFYGCDGQVRILVERVPPADAHGNFMTGLGEAFDRRITCRLRTCYEGAKLGTTLLAATGLIAECPGTFVHCVPLPVRLLLFGTGPEIAPVKQIVQTLGWDAPQFGHASELPDDFRSDSQTAAVVMTHNFGRDLAALDRLLALSLPYVGLLGPQKRSRQLIEELYTNRALDSASLKRIHAPAGLDLGSEAPEEIALSIVSEVAAVLANRQGSHLRDRASGIHVAGEDSAQNVA